MSARCFAADTTPCPTPASTPPPSPVALKTLLYSAASFIILRAAGRVAGLWVHGGRAPVPNGVRRTQPRSPHQPAPAASPTWRKCGPPDPPRGRHRRRRRRTRCKPRAGTWPAVAVGETGGCGGDGGGVGGALAGPAAALEASRWASRPGAGRLGGRRARVMPGVWRAVAPSWSVGCLVVHKGWNGGGGNDEALLGQWSWGAVLCRASCSGAPKPFYSSIACARSHLRNPQNRSSRARPAP